MDKKFDQMNYEINQYSKYGALVISKIYLLILLLITTAYYIYLHYSLVPFYIFASFVILPSLFGELFQKFIPKEGGYLLTTLRKRFKYTHKKYWGNNIAYFYIIFLLMLWQLRHQIKPPIIDFMTYYPVFLIVSSFIIRFVGIIIYTIILRHKLSNSLL